MNEKWKNNLGAYLAEAGAYRIKYLKEQLSKYCEEYRKYLEEFKSVMVKTDNYGDIEDERYLVILKITISTKSLEKAKKNVILLRKGSATVS